MTDTSIWTGETTDSGSCDPLLTGSLVHENGFYPAYHMNKNSWITIALDGKADEEKIKWLLDMSFEKASKS